MSIQMENPTGKRKKEAKSKQELYATRENAPEESRVRRGQGNN
jgi:hypothetical protein